jgi:hypothetical protein
VKRGEKNAGFDKSVVHGAGLGWEGAALQW